MLSSLADMDFLIVEPRSSSALRLLPFVFALAKIFDGCEELPKGVEKKEEVEGLNGGLAGAESMAFGASEDPSVPAMGFVADSEPRMAA